MKQTSKEKISKSKRISQNIQILLFCGVLLAGTILGALYMLRPTVSEREKRELTVFPEFSWQGVMDGSYFAQIETWYADTYPMRELWLEVDQTAEDLYGIRSQQVMGGGGKKADEIPVLPQDESSMTVESKDENYREESIEESGESSMEESFESSVEESMTSRPSVPADPTEVQEAIRGQIQDGLFVSGDAAYSRYYFSMEEAQRYIDMINRVAGELSETTQVYDILIPSSTQIMLEDEVIQQLGGSSEQQAIAYYYGMMSDQVHTIKTFDSLKDHADEYIYFRTDHHWTQLGAYYVYLNFAQEKGVEGHPLSSFEKVNYGEFLGSYYSTSGSKAMKENPDYVEAYIPVGTNEMTFYTVDDEVYEWNVVRDVTDWTLESKYSCFIGGDNPYNTIENPQITDGSSCLLIKESYGNALAPFLVDHYQYVYIVDYRYYEDNLMDLIAEKEIDDLIFANNMSIIGSEYVTERLDRLFS